jgi:hypothetical protein
MEFTSFTRKPFTVDAVQITKENMAEVAELIGELREKDGVQFIAINRRIVPNIHRAFEGWWVTKMGDNLRCYAGTIFTDQFEPTPAAHELQVMNMNGSVVTLVTD